jgi:hypothetical protein
MKHYIQSCEERMKPATPKMTMLQSPVGLRSIVTFLAAFFIVVSTFSLLFERGQQEAKVQMAVEHRNQEMQLKHHGQQLRGQEEEVQVKVVAEAEHHDQQLRGSEAEVKVAAAEHHDQQLRGQEEEVQVKVVPEAEHHDQQLRGSEAGVKVAAAEHHDQQLRGQEEEVQVKVVAAAEHLHDQQLRGSEAGVKVAAAEHHDQQLRGQESEAEVQRRAELQDSSEECNWSTGRWIYDNVSQPLYSGLNCSFIFPEVACDKYGRKDVMYQRWRWQPHGCDLPR